jgi:hypothetical protein
MNIKELASKWDKEKEFYRHQELGTGVHSFIRSCLESEDLFSLKESLLSIKAEHRRNSYIHENKAKEGRQADFVIYIDPDIIIPLEAECFGNIKAGVRQLFEYQKDFDKQYGILTDGFTWRFYNNNDFRKFTLPQIFEEPKIFLEFWKDYIKPENYYLSFFEPHGQLSLLRETERLAVESNRQIFFEDITKLIESFRNKLRIEGYFNGLDRKEALKKATEITYAYIIQFILYKTLVDNRFDDFGNDYKRRIETIHNAIKTHSYGDILGRIDGMSHLISESIYRPFVKEQEYIRGKLLQLYRKPKNELSDVSPWLDIVLFVKKYDFQNVHNEIFGYIYENYLKELYEDEKKGQYFTDPAVVNFMLEQVGYKAKEIRDKIKAGELDKLSIVDPACGSGTFLYSATDEVVKSFSAITDETSRRIEDIVTSNVFGLDIEEFPLYLAEMSILMRMLPLIMGEKYNNPLDKKIKVFLTQDSVAEFIGSGLITLGEQISFPDKVIRPKFESFVRSEEDLTEMKGSMTSFPRRRFDYVIANPPYVSYNECSKQGLLVFALIKKKQVQLNDIFGVNLHSIPNNRKKYAPKPNLYAFFIALGLALLKDDGILCYIIPQNILTAGDLDVLRYHLAKYRTIERIITFNRNLFIERGLKQKKIIPTSSLILIVGKNTPSKTHKVEVVNYKGVEDTIKDTLDNIVAGKKIDTRKVKQADLLENATNWNFIKQEKALLDLYEEYQKITDDISIYYQHDQAENQFNSRFYFDIGFILDPKATVRHGNLDKFYELLDFKTLYGYSRFVPSAYYPRDRNKIELTQNSQGYVTLDQRYKIIWRIKNPDRFCFTDRPIIFYMGKASIICSSKKSEVLYLFSLLNSSLSQFILQAKIRSEAEKEYLVPIKAIKEFVRVPKIARNNQHIKDEIIRKTEEMLALEEKTLSDFVDFSGILVQKFDDIEIDGKTLVLHHGNRKTQLPIKGDAKLVASTIAKELTAEGLKLEERQMSLSELRNLPVIDFEKQTKLKDYIDDLVFALYFLPLEKMITAHKPSELKAFCSKTKYYKLLASN